MVKKLRPPHPPVSGHFHEEDTRKRGLIYARVSTVGQGKDGLTSLDDQIRDCKRYYERNNIRVVERLIFREEYTGAKFSRPELDQVAALAASGSFDCIVFYMTDRMARDEAVSATLAEELWRYGIEIHFTSIGLVKNDAMGRLILNQMAGIDAFGKRLFLERSQKARWSQAEGNDGNIASIPGTGTTPYGYTRTGTRRHPILVENPEQAAVVRLIFSLFNSGLSYRAIVAELTARGHQPPGIKKQTVRTAAKFWVPAGVAEILKREAYVGRYVCRKRLGNTRKLRPESEWIRVPIVPLIDEATWLCAVTRFQDGNRYRHKNRVHESLLARRVRCACGYKVNHTDQVKRDKGRRYGYYSCGSQLKRDNKTSPGCDLRRLPERAVEQAVWEIVREGILRPDRLRKSMEDFGKTDMKDTETAQADLNRAIAQKSKERLNLDNYLQQALDAQEEEERLAYYRMKERSLAEIKRLDSVMAPLKQKLKGSVSYSPEAIDDSCRLVASISPYLHGNPSAEAKRAIIDGLDVTVTFHQLPTGEVRLNIAFLSQLMSVVIGSTYDFEPVPDLSTSAPRALQMQLTFSVILKPVPRAGDQ